MNALPPDRPPRGRSTYGVRLLGVGLIGLAAAAWFLRFEACAHYFTGRRAGYRDLFRSGLQVRDLWMRILIQGAHVGYAHSSMDVDETDPARTYRLTTILEMDFAMMGTRRQIASRLEAELDSLYRLQRFHFRLHSKGYATEFIGRRQRGDQFDVEILTPSGSSRTTITIPDDVILESPLLDQALADLKPGQSRVFRILDPASLGVSDLRVSALREETITIGETPYRATLLEAVVHGMTIQSWVDAEGRLLRQETPMGWTMELADAETAVAYRKRGRLAPPPDLTLSVSIPITFPLPNPRAIQQLTIRLTGLDEWNPSELETDRQQVVRVEETGLVLRIVASGPPSPSEAEGTTGTDRVARDDLASTPFIQSDHPTIRKQAQTILRGMAENDSWANARAINQWVFDHLKKKPTPSLPSAADVLARREGDCNEHAYLTTALLRAAGLPARVVAGLVALDNAFAYHAWVAVRIRSRWVEMDPTFGQPIADATHLALTHGELAEQAKIARYLGRLQISIMDALEGDLSP